MFKYEIAADDVLSVPVAGYFHDYYTKWNDPANSVRFLFNLKNDDNASPHSLIAVMMGWLYEILEKDFGKLAAIHPEKSFTVCGIPRSKAERSYSEDQLGLKRTIRAATMALGLHDGMDYIVRTVDTATTHRKWCSCGAGAGEFPRKGLVRDTCYLSPKIAGKDILLVDDIYTRTVGIDEDAIQALLDCGARSVTFYAVGYTMRSARYRIR